MPTVDAPVIPEHPSKFSKAILGQLRAMVAEERDRRGSVRILDPFAGVGLVHQLAEETIETVGIELQPEWAAADERTICASVMEAPRLFAGTTFDLIVTSPTYGNRMADHHNAEERCSSCDGKGWLTGEFVRRDGSVTDGYQCEACDGKGRRDYTRNTYAHKLREAGAEPVARDDNAQLMQWGAAYRAFHEEAWRACDSVLAPGALVLLNVKNHIRTVRKKEEVQHVVEFHVNTWFRLGYSLEQARRVKTRGLAHGANAEVRTGAELVVALRKPT